MPAVVYLYEYIYNEGLRLANFCLHEASILLAADTFGIICLNLLNYCLRSRYKVK